MWGKFHRIVFIVALCGLAVGLPLNKIVLSISGMVLALNWILEAQFKQKWDALIINRTALLIIGIFMLHIVGLLWSTDLNYGLHDIKIKLPLLFIPLIIASSKPLQKKEVNLILLLFTISVFVTSLINWTVFVYDGLDDDLELRNLSLFTSHIRYALLVVMALCISIYLSFYTRNWQRFALWGVAIWFVYYTLFAQVLSGILTLLFVFIFSAIWVIAKKTSGKRKIASFIGLIISIVSIGAWLIIQINPPIKEQIIVEELEHFTPSGNRYEHVYENQMTENGYYINYYLCKKELEQEWNKKSSIGFYEPDAKGNLLAGTLIRYMTSKGLRKDSAHFSQLTAKDIYYVEQGIASEVYTYGGIRARLAELGLEIQKYKEGNDPNGSTVMERLAFWSTGIHIIEQNFWIGTGTGDVQQAFNTQYAADQTRLQPENRLRTHQQFMTSWITFGVFGFIIFVGFHIFFLLLKWHLNEVIPFLFMIIVISSYLTEDTLETQVGATFVAFFVGLFTHHYKVNK